MHPEMLTREIFRHILLAFWVGSHYRDRESIRPLSERAGRFGNLLNSIKILQFLDVPKYQQRDLPRIIWTSISSLTNLNPTHPICKSQNPIFVGSFSNVRNRQSPLQLYNEQSSFHHLPADGKDTPTPVITRISSHQCALCLRPTRLKISLIILLLSFMFLTLSFSLSTLFFHNIINQSSKNALS